MVMGSTGLDLDVVATPLVTPTALHVKDTLSNQNGASRKGSLPSIIAINLKCKVHPIHTAISLFFPSHSITDYTYIP